jgi:hypothetical protein
MDTDEEMSEGGSGLVFRRSLARIFHGETGKTMATPCSAGFQTCVPRLFNHAFERVCAPVFHRAFRDSLQNGYEISGLACRIAGFQTCVPCLFNYASELVDTPLFMGVFTSLSKWL